MKTNVIMNRDMGGLTVNQRTKDGMFNATSLLKQWNTLTQSGKKLDHFFENKSTQEFIQALLDEQNLHTPNSVYVKSRASRGDSAGTWMHPYLFIDFAMWINPKFKLQVIKFVYDELIENRHLAGDNYKILSSSGAKLPGYNFSEVATAIQWIVFDTRGKNLRQSANTEQLKEIADIETKLAFAIDMNYITSYKQLIGELKKLWNQKYRPNPILA